MGKIDIIVKFVERKISIEDFLESLYHDEELEKILSEDIKLSPFTYLGETTYLYLLDQNINTPGGLLNSLSVLEEFLEKKQVKFEKNNEAAKQYSLMLKVQPNWLDIPDWYLKKILELSDNRTGKELEVFLREKIKHDFRYTKKPPKWVQNPAWIIRDNKPLLFIGQLELDFETFHDKGAVYVFLDTESGEIETVKQLY